MKTTLVQALCGLVLLVLIVEYTFGPTRVGSLQPIYEIGLGFQFGLIAFVYTQVLSQPGHLLAFWRSWIEKLYLEFHVKQMNKFNQKQLEERARLADEELKFVAETKPYDLTLEMANHRWVLKPIIDCDWCIGGEWALIWYPFITHSTYSFNGHLAAISVAILTAGIAGKLWTRIN